MGHDTFFAGAHGEGLETEDMTHHLYKRHLACQFVDGIDLRAVHVFVRVVFEQVTIGLNAKFITQHFLAVGPYAWQVFDVLI